MSGIIKNVAIFVLIGIAMAVEYVALSAGQDSKGPVSIETHAAAWKWTKEKNT